LYCSTPSQSGVYAKHTSPNFYKLNYAQTFRFSIRWFTFVILTRIEETSLLSARNLRAFKPGGEDSFFVKAIHSLNLSLLRNSGLNRLTSCLPGLKSSFILPDRIPCASGL
jgi:hypothetical protein